MAGGRELGGIGGGRELKGGGQQLVGVGEGGVRMHGIERDVENLWARV